MGSRFPSSGRLVSAAGTVVALALLLVGGAVAAETAFELLIAEGPVLGAPGVGLGKGAAGLAVFVGGYLVLRTVARRDASPPSEDEEHGSDAASRFILDW
ncbi:hypothetical protein [Halosimplex pelagicum]|uniref:Uncharacterized protein n=1 Tax=Halosimplex pelagicum TaxID=869886 RepID=A0A7D5TS44_9EURY|nr:hypothetical protein [Halosimplex pelagicum]QLH80234.1 hypothetical protein HZS54_00720 [Halosimplex pelagicum]